MRRYALPALVATVFCIATVASADEWQKFISADGTFSFHHPAGWTVFEQPSSVLVESGDGRQISLIAVPYHAGQSAEEHARRMLNLLAVGNPGLQAENWRADGEDLAYAEVTFTEDGVAQAGDVLVVRDAASQQALWFGFSAPAAGYDRPAALEMLETVMGSLATGDGSQAPAAAVTLSADEQEVVNAFLFTVEFALGQPLDLASERTIADELAQGLAARGESFDDLSMYPPLAQQIMGLDQQQLDELQNDLHGLLIEWLNDSDADDPAVAIVRERIEAGRQVVAAGDPALNAAAAQAYSEMFAMSELLHRQPEASVADIPADVVSEIRGQLAGAWPNLSAEERRQILTVPGLWGVLRHALLPGTGEQPAQARSILLDLTPAPQTTPEQQATATATADVDIRDEMTRSFIYGETLRMMQQHTFNTWRWSMGYCKGPMGF